MPRRTHCVGNRAVSQQKISQIGASCAKVLRVALRPLFVGARQSPLAAAVVVERDAVVTRVENRVPDIISQTLKAFRWPNLAPMIHGGADAVVQLGKQRAKAVVFDEHGAGSETQRFIVSCNIPQL